MNRISLILKWKVDEICLAELRLCPIYEAKSSRQILADDVVDPIHQPGQILSQRMLLRWAESMPASSDGELPLFPAVVGMLQNQDLLRSKTELDWLESFCLVAFYSID